MGLPQELWDPVGPLKGEGLSKPPCFAPSTCDSNDRDLHSNDLTRWLLGANPLAERAALGHARSAKPLRRQRRSGPGPRGVQSHRARAETSEEPWGAETRLTCKDEIPIEFTQTSTFKGVTNGSPYTT